ncbi:histidinol-phosphate transaminase [uncultured Croceitalea sp.]|uniref:histidinol-phosphate transaminase n=1 Tax=uncultured Croceitalea sp. TaxID=1798908 RepID=UPI00374E2167
MGFQLDILVRENIKALQPYSSARDEFTSKNVEMIFLDANENPYDNGVNRYPDPQQKNIKSVLSTQKRIREEQILLGNGSDEVLDLLFRAFCEPNKDNIISLPPTYGMYKVLSGTNAIENREVLLTTEFQPDVAKVLTKVDKNTKLLFLCSPNNPTGNLLEKEKIKELLTNFKGLVVIDEAYIDFSGSESWINSLNDYPNLVVTQTLSKAYAMAGIRLGMCYASEDIINILKKIKPPYNINELTQQRALKGIENSKALIAQIASILEERKRLIKKLGEIFFVQKTYDSHANFILAKVDDAELRYNQLIERGIVIRNRTKQPLCSNTLRFTVGTPKENTFLIKALKAI